MKFSLFLIAVITSFQLISGPGNEAVSYFDKALKANVTSSGIVNYTAMKSDANFINAIKLYKGLSPESTWTKNEKMAYWINVYNAFTIQLIIDNYPVKSINDIEQPWDQKFIVINGKQFSLNQIEHEILRAKFKDPRVHFAVNCASYSCPKLHNKAFRAETLDRDLSMLTKGFLSDQKRNKLSTQAIQISNIFDWFKEDFTNGQTLIEFINTYSDVQVDSGASISYLDYNWNLNNK